MQLFYNLGIAVFRLGARLWALFNERAALLVKGRSSVWKQLNAIDLSGPVIWVHCASLGEFEQGRPLIEAIRDAKPDYKIVLSFFSPSGYEVRKNYNKADAVVYLPADTRRNARRFVQLIHPEKVFFIKYEYWFHYFKTLSEAGIPLYSVSSIFRPSQIFFKWYGGWFRRILSHVTQFYVQDETSSKLLNSIGIHNHVVAGDTRFDRVAAIAKHADDLPVVAEFSHGAKVLVAGSSWPPDESILADYINNAPANVKFIIAPHEVHEGHISELIQKFKVPVCRYSQLNDTIPTKARVLIIDTIGVLSAIYRYGSVAYIGGGFGKGIHNTLEAATYGIPVIFGPNHQKFKEAMDLIAAGGGFNINTRDDFDKIMSKLWNNDPAKSLLEASGRAAGDYVQSMCGATPLIMNNLFL